MGQKKKYNFLYKTTCLVNQKYYIGVRSTDKLDDGYIGCGILNEGDARMIVKNGQKSPLANAVLKHGYNNFKREIIKFYDTSKNAYIDEKSIVDYDFILSPNNYNARVGGIGGNARKVPFSKEEEVKNLHKNNYSVKDIEKITGVKSYTISRITKGLSRLPKYVWLRKDNNPVFFSSTKRELNDVYGKSFDKYCVLECCKGNVSNHKNELFLFYKDYEEGLRKNRFKKKGSKHKGRKLIKNGVEYKIKSSAADFCREHDMCPVMFSKLLDGTRKSPLNGFASI